MNNESKRGKKNKVSFINLPFPIIFFLFAIVLIIIISWIKKENFSIVGFIVIMICISSITFRKFFEINRKQFTIYNQFLVFRTNRIRKTFEIVYKININKIEKEIAITDSWHRSFSASSSNIYYALEIETNLENNIIVYKSKDYNHIIKIGKLFSNYYNIEISKENILIEYPEFDRHNKIEIKQKPKIKRRRENN